MVRNYSIKELSRRVTQTVFKRHLFSSQTVQFSTVQLSTVWTASNYRSLSLQLLWLLPHCESTSLRVVT